MLTLPPPGKRGFGNVYFGPSGRRCGNVYFAVLLENIVLVMSTLVYQEKKKW